MNAIFYKYFFLVELYNILKRPKENRPEWHRYNRGPGSDNYET